MARDATATGLPKLFGIIPPRLNKSYSQHWMAQMILEPTIARVPDEIMMWGVGLSESDVDLNDLYKAWVSRAKEVKLINPSQEVAKRVQALLSCKVAHFSSVAEWESVQ